MLMHCLKILANACRRKLTSAVTGLKSRGNKLNTASASAPDCSQRKGFAAGQTAKCSGASKRRATSFLRKATGLGYWPGRMFMSAWLASTAAQKSRAFLTEGLLKRFLLNSTQNQKPTRQQSSQQIRESASWESRQQARSTYPQKLPTNGLTLPILQANQTATFFAHISTVMT